MECSYLCLKLSSLLSLELSRELLLGKNSWTLLFPSSLLYSPYLVSDQGTDESAGAAKLPLHTGHHVRKPAGMSAVQGISHRREKAAGTLNSGTDTLT